MGRKNNILNKSDLMNMESHDMLKLMVPMERIELSRGCPHRILSPARLPVPPHRHSFYSIQNINIDMIVFIGN